MAVGVLCVGMMGVGGELGLRLRPAAWERR